MAPILEPFSFLRNEKSKHREVMKKNLLAKMSSEELFELKKAIELEQEKRKQEKKGKTVLGFTLTESVVTNTIKGKKYLRKTWQAYRGIAGKKICIYIGKDPGKAENKIKAYLEKYTDIREQMKTNNSELLK